VFPLLGLNNQNGYGVVHKKQIERFDCNLNTSELVKKTPKINEK
jgi:hypothetical protein